MGCYVHACHALMLPERETYRDVETLTVEVHGKSCSRPARAEDDYAFFLCGQRHCGKRSGWGQPRIGRISGCEV